MELSKCKIGIRPTIDGRWGGIREGLEEQTMGMAKAAKALIEANLTYSDGTPVQVVIADSTIGGGREAALCADSGRCAGKDSALRPLRHCGRRNAQQSLRQHRCDCDGHHGQLLRPGFLPEVFRHPRGMGGYVGNHPPRQSGNLRS